MPSDREIAEGRERTIQGLRASGVSSKAAEAIATACATNSDRRARGLDTSPRAIPTHLLKER